MSGQIYGALDNPGPLATRTMRHLLAHLPGDYPSKRIVAAAEIAKVIMFLASDDASAVVGHDLDATGGFLAK